MALVWRVAHPPALPPARLERRDYRVARHLLRQRWTPAQVREILGLASPHFPRRHANPDDYLRRTVARADTVGGVCSFRAVGRLGAR